jgi:hypothetical protein
MNIIDKIKLNNKVKTNEINKILNKKNKYLIRFEIKNNIKNISLLTNNKKIISGTYNVHGIYQPTTKLWVWASSIPNIEKKTLANINKIKSFNHLFENASDKISLFYYQLLTQDTIIIKDTNMLDWINHLLLYFSNDVYYFNPYNEERDIEFISLSCIKEKFV